MCDCLVVMGASGCRQLHFRDAVGEELRRPEDAVGQRKEPDLAPFGRAISTHGRPEGDEAADPAGLIRRSDDSDMAAPGVSQPVHSPRHVERIQHLAGGGRAVPML